MTVQSAIPKLISMLGSFYIGRMLTSDVDFLPAHLWARIKTSATGAGDTNYMNGRGVSGVSGVTWGYRPAHADRAQVNEAARVAVNAFSQYLDLPCMKKCVPKTGARLSARDPRLKGPSSVP